MVESTESRAAAWTVPVVPVERVLAHAGPLVDLRSPREFAEDHLPGARNAPLFDDVERAVVGTLYKRRSPAEAFEEARYIVASRIEGLVSAIGLVAGREPAREDLARRVLAMTERGMEGVQSALRQVPAGALPDSALVVHCWRGGMRSASVVALLRALGWKDVVALQGGYKTYRRQVIDSLAAWEAPPAFVLRGLTGVGKTLVLRELERQRPGWTFDLEEQAAHRSSILGMVGLEPVSQKAFESAIAARLRRGFPGLVVYEGESRKVGDAIVPERVWASLSGGTNLRLVASTARRVEVLSEDYLAHVDSRDELRRQLPFIEERLGPRKWKGELVRLLDEDRVAELVEVLLERYYDPLYRHSEKGRAYTVELDATDPARCAREAAEWIEARSPSIAD